MMVFMKPMLNLLFNLILGLFFILFLLKISCCKLSDIKDDHVSFLSTQFTDKHKLIKEYIIHFISNQRSLLNGLNKAVIRNVYSDLSERIIRKK